MIRVRPSLDDQLLLFNNISLNICLYIRYMFDIMVLCQSLVLPIIKTFK